MVEIKKKFSSLKKQLVANKLKLKKTSVEWALDHIINAYNNEVDFPFLIEIAKIASITPITNAWPERGASAVKRIKSRTRSTMKDDLLNALLHISINGPPANSNEAENLITRVVDEYVKEKHYKVPQIYSAVKTGSSSSTQTETIIGIDDEMPSDIDILNNQNDDFMITNFENYSSSEEEIDDIDSESE